ncbi:hypothetical protein FQR65_LT11175 [Abscondita terminalis]|nr:hypothetical protein FQR65_LT11175 [Abscondita terminalis]
MASSTLYFVILMCVMRICTEESARAEEPNSGYYWRDYEGIIPCDAYPSGLDSSGRNIYVGQVLHGNKLIPGKIYEGDPNIYFQYRQAALQSATNIKILCTKSPHALEWYATTANDIPMITNQLIVRGGFEPNTYTYVGRVYTGGETAVGKVICLDTECLGLYIAKDGRAILFDKALELLMLRTPGTV